MAVSALARLLALQKKDPWPMTVNVVSAGMWSRCLHCDVQLVVSHLPGKVFLSLGMGLLICRSIITAHGGQLWVANNLAHGADAQAAAESCFQQALDIACRQQAKALELRALISLSRLWQQHGKRAQAHGVLAELYGWFTEGFDTVDLQEAKVLLLALEG